MQGCSFTPQVLARPRSARVASRRDVTDRLFNGNQSKQEQVRRVCS